MILVVGLNDPCKMWSVENMENFFFEFHSNLLGILRKIGFIEEMRTT